MESLVETYIQKAGFIKDQTYFKEMYAKTVEKKWGLDLAAITNGGKSKKRFDFVVKTESTVYVLETNFYKSKGGSKLNETARSYKELAEEAALVSGIKYVWITDGPAWNYAKNNLEETFDILDNLYNINDMEQGVLKEAFK